MTYSSIRRAARGRLVPQVRLVPLAQQVLEVRKVRLVPLAQQVLEVRKVRLVPLAQQVLEVRKVRLGRPGPVSAQPPSTISPTLWIEASPFPWRSPSQFG